MERKKTRPVWLGTVQVGGGAPISVQSMTNTDTRDIAATVEQINKLALAGCEIVRVAVPDLEAADALSFIKDQINIPLVADIHFDYRLALAALDKGVDGLRINPGNIGGRERVFKIAAAAKARKVPIRIGVNAGSLEKNLLDECGKPTASALVKSALREIRLLEEVGFFDLKVSVKSSDVPMMLEAYQMLSEKTDYPLHLGVTEAGTLRSGAVKSAVGIGILLSKGIGDTIRVSLTGNPLEEVRVGYDILKSLGLRARGIELISCPTCARTQIDLIKIASEIEEKLEGITAPLKIAVMGCVVNGPLEAKNADLGVAGGKGTGLIFRRGKVIKSVQEKELVSELVREAEQLAAQTAIQNTKI